MNKRFAIILHITKGKDRGEHGTRMPLVYLMQPRQLVIVTDFKNDQGKHKEEAIVVRYQDNKLYHVLITQKLLTPKTTRLEVWINGKLEETAKSNYKMTSLTDKLLYLSDPWNPSAGEFVEVTDLKIKSKSWVHVNLINKSKTPAFFNLMFSLLNSFILIMFSICLPWQKVLLFPLLSSAPHP